MAEINEGINLLANTEESDGSLNIDKVSIMHPDLDRLFTIELGLTPKSGEDITKYVPADVILILDVSGSMDTSMGGGGTGWESTRMYGLIQAADSIVEELGPRTDGTRIGIVIFGSSASDPWSAHKIILDFSGDKDVIMNTYYPTRAANTNPRNILAGAGTREVVRVQANTKWYPLVAPYTNFNQTSVENGSFFISTGTNHQAGLLGALELFKYSQNERKDSLGNPIPSKKYVIFMTDGEMTTTYSATGTSVNGTINQYWGLSTNPSHVGPTVGELTTLQQALDLKTTYSIADPHTDIEIYTVAYGPVADPTSTATSSESARKILNPGHPSASATFDYDATRRYEYQKKFIPAPSTAELQEAFKEIAADINREIPFNQIRITDPMGVVPLPGSTQTEAMSLLYDRNGDGSVTAEDISVLVDGIECSRDIDPSDPTNPLKAIFSYTSSEGWTKTIEIELTYVSTTKQYTIHFFHQEALDDGREYVIQYDVLINIDHESYEPGASYPANDPTEVAYNYAGDDYVDQAPIPQIIYAPVKETINGLKVGRNGSLIAGAFEFGLFYDPDGLLPVEDGGLALRAVNDEAGEFEFDVNLARPTIFTFYMREINQILGDGWDLDPNPISVKITVEESDVGVLMVTGTEYSRPYFENSYKGGKAVEITILGKKHAFPIPTGGMDSFEFGLFEGSSSTPIREVNDPNGDFSYTIEIDEPGDYLYYVRELSPDAYGWKSDPTIYTYTITVTDNFLGELEAEIFGDLGTILGNQIAIEFTNTFELDEVSTLILASKIQEGWNQDEKEFHFKLQETSPGTNTYEATNKDGVIEFVVSYSRAGTYRYEMYEEQVSAQGWDIDVNRYVVHVEVKPNAEGVLVPDIKYFNTDGTELNEAPKFINHYDAGVVDVVIRGSKTGNTAFLANTFQFQLLNEKKVVIDTVSNDANGEFVLNATFSKGGVYAYTVKEVPTSGNGWTADSREFPVLITIEDIGGKLMAKVEYPLPVLFENTYSTGSNTAEIFAKKELIGWNKDGAGFVETFEFDLVDKNGRVLQTETNDANGVICFKVTFADFYEAGDYEFKIVEKALTTKPGWELLSPVNNAQRVQVKVEVNANHQLISTIDYLDSMLFENKYMPAPTSEVLSGVVTTVGAPLPQDPFEVGLFENGVLIDTQFTPDGSYSFDLSWNKVGAYHYEVRQIGDKERKGWVLIDASLYEITILVMDNYHGQLFASTLTMMGAEECDQKRLDFQNVYQAATFDPGISSFKEFKTWNGIEWVDWNQPPEEKLFEFKIVDPEIGDSGKTMDTANSVNGQIDFTMLYNEAGTYQYEIREVQTPRLGWSLDPSVFLVSVAIETDYENGSFKKTSLVYKTVDGNPPRFINYYKTPKVEVDLSATIEIRGWYGKKEFPVILTDASGNIIGEAIWSVDGFVQIPHLPELTFSEEGTYQFIVYQPKSDDKNWKIDERRLSVIITAYHDGAGGLAISLEYPEGEWHFINEYVGLPECTCLTLEADVEICKTERICPGTFRFSLTGKEGQIHAVAKTHFKNECDYCLVACFSEICFTKPGIYKFTMWQLSAHPELWNFDQTKYPVKVIVEAKPNGELFTQVIYPKGCPIFTNRYGR